MQCQSDNGIDCDDKCTTVELEGGLKNTTCFCSTNLCNGSPILSVNYAIIGTQFVPIIAENSVDLQLNVQGQLWFGGLSSQMERSIAFETPAVRSVSCSIDVKTYEV